MDCKLYNAYLNILREELVPAMGCTEPIALAYAAASARALLGKMPERVQVVLPCSHDSGSSSRLHTSRRSFGAWLHSTISAFRL